MQNTPLRFYSLDVLRGLAALCVVFWHWQHFFYTGTRAGIVTAKELPLYKIFFLFYHEGYLAVELFFCLSGFVFYWLYAKAIAERTVSAREFFVLRFSRLYPLHFATLAAVVIGQLIFYAAFKTYYVYTFNDVFHLLLNVFFVSSWGFERGYSFNAPIWSVSVEVFAYALFFCFCRLVPVRLISALAISVAGFALGFTFYAPIGRGIGSFFLGGCACLCYEWVVGKGYTRQAAWSLISVTVLFWLAAIVTISDTWGVHSAALEYLPLISPIVSLVAVVGKPFAKWPQATLFPMSVLALALLETSRGSLGKRLAFLGDISYSSYLFHFPLQLVLMTLVLWLSISQTVFSSPAMLVAFFVLLLLVSFASYNFYELPAQRFLRKKFLSDRPRERIVKDVPQMVS